MNGPLDHSTATDPRLAGVAAGLAPFVERGDLSGIVTLTWQKGQIRSVNVLDRKSVV